MKSPKQVIMAVLIVGSIIWFLDAGETERSTAGKYIGGALLLYCAYLLLKDWDAGQRRVIETQAAVSRIEDRLELFHRQIGDIEVAVDQIRERYRRPQPDFYDHVTRDRD